MAQASPGLDQLLHAIADPVRRHILRVLKENDRAGAKGPLCAFDIEQRIKLAQPTVSHHMRILVKAGFVQAKREGHKQRYRRNEKFIAEMMKGLRNQL